MLSASRTPNRPLLPGHIALELPELFATHGWDAKPDSCHEVVEKDVWVKHLERYVLIAVALLHPEGDRRHRLSERGRLIQVNL